MATFFNQATLSFGGNIVNSNTTEAELLSGLSITKTAITPTYTAGGNVVYAITVTNMSGTTYNALTVNDNLGAYTVPGGTTTVTPLTYVDGSIIYYLNGALQTAPTVVGTPNMQISGINLPENSTATFIYEARVNEFAPIGADSTITNTATVDGGAGIGELTASAIVTTVAEPILTVAKAVCPTVVTDNGELTYTIIVQNLGNTPIIATDNVVISDTFNPVLSNITVELDGVVLTEGTEYTYNETTGGFATTNGTITVPAATFTQNPTTGVVTTTPGVAVLTITGTV